MQNSLEAIFNAFKHVNDDCTLINVMQSAAMMSDLGLHSIASAKLMKLI